jgi:hypothetical protein
MHLGSCANLTDDAIKWSEEEVLSLARSAYQSGRARFAIETSGYVDHYNTVRHSAIGFLTPQDMLDAGGSPRGPRSQTGRGAHNNVAGAAGRRL